MTNPKRKRKALYGTITGPKREVKYLQPYYFQGGKWHKLKTKSRG